MSPDGARRTHRRGLGRRRPNGSHVNVVLAAPREPDGRRGGRACSRTPRPGHTPVLVCVGPTQARYEPVWPPTLMMNKATALDERHQTMTWGAAQLGIGQGVLDAVADGLLEATGRPPRARRGLGRPGAPTTRRRCGRRTASATRKAIGMCVEGRDPTAARRARRRARLAAQPVLQRRLNAHRGDRDAALPVPARAAVPASPGTRCRARTRRRRSSIVRSDDGIAGYASGDALPDRELLERLLVGVDPSPTPRSCARSCETVDFHGGRPWTAEVAVWDLVGRARDEPVWQLLGGRASGSSPTRRAASSSTPTSACAGASRCATRACAR